MIKNDTLTTQDYHEEELMQFITFTVNEQEYAVDIMLIKEIKGWVETTTLPNTPHYMRGVINLRGSVVPILDLRCRFGLGLTQTTKNHVVMIVHIEGRMVGILVDAVSDIITLSSSDIRPIPSIDLSDHTQTVLQGLINLENRMIAVLCLDKIFDHRIEILKSSYSVSNFIPALENDEVKAPYCEAGETHA